MLVHLRLTVPPDLRGRRAVAWCSDHDCINVTSAGCVTSPSAPRATWWRRDVARESRQRASWTPSTTCGALLVRGGILVWSPEMDSASRPPRRSVARLPATPRTQ